MFGMNQIDFFGCHDLSKSMQKQIEQMISKELNKVGLSKTGGFNVTTYIAQKFNIDNSRDAQIQIAFHCVKDRAKWEKCQRKLAIEQVKSIMKDSGISKDDL